LLPAEKTKVFKSADEKLKQSQKPKYKPCLGKTYGYSCQTCAVRSYWDRVPENNQQ